LIARLKDLTDPRINRRRRHLFLDIVIIAVCGVIANADSWKSIVIWAKAREAWLRTFLELPNGIPSRDTIRRTISRLNPEEFQRCFVGWLGGLRGMKLVAIDGKTMRGSASRAMRPLHIVSAWASQQRLTLGQRCVDSKTNEITAIPELLRLLDLQGAIITIDAMGCQKAIASEIINRGADYCLAVRGNQPTLEADAKQLLGDALLDDFQGHVHHCYKTTENKHGRCERRIYYTMPVPAALRNQQQWAGLKTIGMAIRETGPENDPNVEIRYYIASFSSDAKKFAAAVRGHWGIENSLHWVLDVTFREDDSRIRKGHGGDNVGWLRKVAISLLSNERSYNETIRAKRQRAGYDLSYLDQVLQASIFDN
jgi:predicted transposase YbfD/YdcC